MAVNKRTVFKKLTAEQLANPLKQLVFNKKFYSKDYLRRLPYIIRKRYLTNEKRNKKRSAKNNKGSKGKR